MAETPDAKFYASGSLFKRAWVPAQIVMVQIAPFAWHARRNEHLWEERCVKRQHQPLKFSCFAMYTHNALRSGGIVFHS